MKVVCDRAAFVQSVQLAASVVPHRSPKPVLGCIRIEAEAEGVTLLATDLEVGLRITTGQVETADAGTCLVPADRFHPIVRELEAESVTLEATELETEITAPGARFKVLGDDPADFPQVPEFPESGAMTMGADDLLALIERTIFATARENTRYALNGILWEVDGANVTLVATDGRRLALARGKCEGGPEEKVSAIVPAKAVQLLQRCLDGLGDPNAKVEVSLGEKEVLVRSPASDAGRWTVYSRLVDGHFPKYDDVVPKETDKRATIGTSAFVGAVRKVALLTNEESRGVTLTFGEKELVLTSRTPEMGEAEVRIEVGYAGEPIEIRFDPAFLSDAAKVVDAEEFQLAFKGPNKPGVLTEGKLFTYVVMPISSV